MLRLTSITEKSTILRAGIHKSESSLIWSRAFARSIDSRRAALRSSTTQNTPTTNSFAKGGDLSTEIRRGVIPPAHLLTQNGGLNSVGSLSRPPHIPLSDSEQTWEALELHPQLIENLKGCGYPLPSTIQCRAFDSIASAQDSVIVAETGCGKTIAYLLPFLDQQYRAFDNANKTHGDSNLKKARPVVVVLPTRDLCAQVAEEILTIDRHGCVSVQSLVPFPDRAAVAASRRKLELMESRGVPGQPSSEFHRTSFFSTFEGPNRTVLFGRRILWDASDVVVTTPNIFLEELRRCMFEKAYPSAVIFDEVDALVQGNESRLDFFDILKIMRPRLVPNSNLGIPHSGSSVDIFKKFYEASLQQSTNLTHHNATGARLMANRFHQTHFTLQNKHNLKKGPVPCQFIAVGATMPAMGYLSTGAMWIERFPTSTQVRSNAVHQLPSGVKANFIHIGARALELPSTVQEGLKSSASKEGKVRSAKGNQALDHFDARFEILVKDVLPLSLKPVQRQYFGSEGTPDDDVHGDDVLFDRTVIFTNSQASARKLFSQLQKQGFPVVSFHRAMGMRHRLHALAEFHASNNPIVVCTDLGARGLDFLKVKHVINFHAPLDANNFLHRAGRCGRANETGLVTTMVTEDKRGRDLNLEIFNLMSRQRQMHIAFSRKRSLNIKTKAKRILRQERLRIANLNRKNNTTNINGELKSTTGGYDARVPLHVQEMVKSSKLQVVENESTPKNKVFYDHSGDDSERKIMAIDSDDDDDDDDDGKAVNDAKISNKSYNTTQQSEKFDLLREFSSDEDSGDDDEDVQGTSAADAQASSTLVGFIDFPSSNDTTSRTLKSTGQNENNNASDPSKKIPTKPHMVPGVTAKGMGVTPKSFDNILSKYKNQNQNTALNVTTQRSVQQQQQSSVSKAKASNWTDLERRTKLSTNDIMKVKGRRLESDRPARPLDHATHLPNVGAHQARRRNVGKETAQAQALRNFDAFDDHVTL